MNWPAFTNPWLLAGVAAVGLPVLIHYLTRARPRQVAFPPFKFLLESSAGRQALHRLRTITLLTLRSLAILALVFWFARPFLKPSGSAAGPAANERVVLLLDASLSMRAVQGGVTLFARAQAEAADVLRGLESRQEVGVILVGSTPHPLLPALSHNLPALHGALVKAEPTFEFGDFQAALTMAKRWLGGAGTIYLFSDFQRSNWDAVGELPAGVVCRLRPATSEPVGNVALTDVRLAPEEPVAGETTEVLCSISNYSANPREEVVRLQLGDYAQERRVKALPFSTADCGFTVNFPREGVFSGRAWLEPDDLREDNTRYVAVRVQKELRVLLLSDVEQNDPRSAAFFLSRALVPSPQAAPGIQLIRRQSQDADRGVLETSDVFILVAPAIPSGEAVEIITRRVQEGARFLAVLDGPTSPSLVPTAFNPPFRLLRPVLSPTGETLVRGLRTLSSDSDASEWATIPFRRHYQNQLLAGREADVLFSYPDGSAAVSLNNVGKGAAGFVNLPLTPDGGDLVGSPLFPVTIQELLRALRRSSESRETNPGMPWVIEAATTGEGPLTVFGPDGAALEAQLVARGRTSRLALPVASKPGVYAVQQSGSVVGAEAVNTDRRESDPRSISLEALKPAAGGAVAIVRGEEDLLLSGKARPLWPHLACAATVFLALEMLLLSFWRSPQKGPRPSAASPVSASTEVSK